MLLTGVNGFTGHYLAEQLIKKGYGVVGTGKGTCRLSLTEENFIYQSLDITSDDEVQQVFNKYQPDTVIHSAAMTKPDECELNNEAAYLVNVTGTSYLLRASSKLHSHFVYVSTDFIFGGNKEIYNEEDEGSPVNYYGKTKLLAEAEVKCYGDDWNIVRTSLVYGHPKSGRQNILTNVAAALQKGQVLNMYHDQRRKPTYVEDLAKGIVRMIERRAKGIYHFSGEDILTPYEMACATADYLGLNKRLINAVTAETFKQPAFRPAQTIFDLSKAKADLGYESISFEEGLRKTFE